MFLNNGKKSTVNRALVEHSTIFPGHFFFLCSPFRSAACDNAETKCSRTMHYLPWTFLLCLFPAPCDGTSGAEWNAKKEIEQGGEGGRGRVCGNEFKIIHSHEL